ncbi:MAG: metalloregulator ArsR/SmtB family transcription factor [Ilumatobacteraceae bacterium]|nr:metalloregulator ArsR/SmtB family transcription factor [Ilumatobacteraceae bacterium]
MTNINISKTPSRIAIAACCSPESTTPFTHDDAATLAKVFAALGDPIRLKLFTLIARDPSQEVCACSFVDELQRSQPTISHHLKILREAALITGTKRGTWIWYSVNTQALSEVREFLS